MKKASIQYTCKALAVFSDIHSNYHALWACFEDACREGADCFIFLGDYVSGLAETQKTMDLVYEIQSRYPTLCIKGNRERYMADHRKGSAPFAKDPLTGSYLFTYEKLREADHTFFASLPFFDTVHINGLVFEIAHATKHEDRHLFKEDDPYIQEVFAQMDAKYFLTGHSHRQYIRTQRDKTIINPGSVGLPLGTSGAAQYALLGFSHGDVSCQLRTVPYDFTPVVHSQFSSGLMEYAKYWAISDLYNAITGTAYTQMLLDCVYQNAADDKTLLHDTQTWHKIASELHMCFEESDILDFLKNAVQ